MPNLDPKEFTRNHLKFLTAILTVAAYLLVHATFQGWIPYPDITEETVNLLSHGIAAVNTLGIVFLLLGWRYIRNNEVRKHRICMSTAFTLIILFMLMYLPKVGGGGEKYLAGAPEMVYTAYLIMLFIHISLSVVAMPLVIYVILIGWSHAIDEIYDTKHAAIGRIAATAWIISLALGVTTYVILNQIYTYDFEPLAITAASLLI